MPPIRTLEHRSQTSTVPLNRTYQHAVPKLGEHVHILVKVASVSRVDNEATNRIIELSVQFL